MRRYLSLLVLQLVTRHASAGVKPIAQPISAPDDVLAGDAVRLMCTYRKGTAPMEFTWKRNQLPVETGLGVSVESIASHSSILQLDAIRPAQAGNYSCTVSNSAGSDTSFAELLVKGLPRTMQGSYLVVCFQISS